MTNLSRLIRRVTLKKRPKIYIVERLSKRCYSGTDGAVDESSSLRSPNALDVKLVVGVILVDRTRLRLLASYIVYIQLNKEYKIHLANLARYGGH